MALPASFGTAWSPASKRWPRVRAGAATVVPPGTPKAPREDKGSRTLAWQVETRCLELDDAVRRSVARRRATLLEYPEASEEVGFKGTMTLVGCGVLWGSLLIFLAAAWFPWLLWTILPLLVLFLVLQSFGLLASRDRPRSDRPKQQ